MRRPLAGSPLAPFAGWLAAWGAASLAAMCLLVAGVTLGLGFGLADTTLGGIDTAAFVDSGDFWPSVWMLIIQAAAFLAGGYVAARMARRLGTLHAVAAWAIAMVASGADAIAAQVHDEAQVLAGLALPTWANNGFDASFGTAIAYAILAVGSLAGAILGGMLGDAANRMDVARARHAQGLVPVDREAQTRRAGARPGARSGV
jgi:hypothetical protein